MKQVNHKGFTLIELLVVIAIIGVLSTLAVVALGSARIKARDAKRVADVRQIMSALELYYNDVNQYPTSLVAEDPIQDGTTVYMNSVPENPAPATDGGCPDNDSYLYTPQGTPVTGYTITYCLGGKVGDIGNGTRVATPAGLTSGN